MFYDLDAFDSCSIVTSALQVVFGLIEYILNTSEYRNSDRIVYIETEWHPSGSFSSSE